MSTEKTRYFIINNRKKLAAPIIVISSFFIFKTADFMHTFNALWSEYAYIPGLFISGALAGLITWLEEK